MRENLRKILPYLRPYKSKFAQAALAMVGVAAFNGAYVYLVKPLIDNISMLRDKKQLLILVVFIPAAYFLKMIVQYIQAYLMSYIGQRVTQNIREDLFRHLHELSLEFYWRKRSGEIMSRVTSDLNNVQSALQFLPLYFVRDTMIIVVLFGWLFYINWRFTLIALLLGPLAGAVIGILGRKMRRASSKSQAIIGHVYHRFQESLEGMAIVKAFNYEAGAIDRFRKENDALFSQMMRYLRATALSGPLLEFLGSLVIALLLYFGGKEMLSGRMTAGDFASFLLAFFLVYSPLKNLAQANSSLQLGLVSWGRILNLLEEKPAVVRAVNAKIVQTLKGRITFEDVSYRYPTGHHYALKGVNIDIAPGEVVAFVGASGSGKTTLANLLLRLFDPVSGRVLYDGEDLKGLDISSLRNHIGLVSQTTVLFDDTVANNIALGSPSSDRQAIEEAAQIADAHEFITRLPAGYDTVLGERGVKLSGGQRQRLAIARAVLKKPSVLILDEATSNLDTTSEKAVQSSIEKLLTGRTVLMIAHRLSTIQNANRIFVLHHGQVIEQGCHDALIAKSGVYRKLYEIQITGV